MSEPTSTSLSTDPTAGLIVVAATQLVPLFQTKSTGFRGAHKMAMSAIAAYHPESRADYVNVARTIAFSMAALALLAKVAVADMPIPDLMRVYGRANALNRSADQSERTMNRRRAYHTANPPAELPAWMDPGLEAPEPEIPTDAALFQTAVAEAMREYDAAVTPSETQTPAPASTPAPPATAIRHATPAERINLPPSRPAGIALTDQPRTAPYKTTLMRNSAMPAVALRSTG